MRPFLTFLVPVYWMAAFAIMAARTAAQPSGLELIVPGAGNAWHGGVAAAGLGVSAGLSIVLGLVATLFLWAFLTAVLDGKERPGGYEEVASVAVGAAVLVLIADLLLSALAGGQAILGDGPYQLGALLASYAAVIFERRFVAVSRSSEGDDVRAAARHMALGAAHSSMLGRLAGQSRSGAD